MRRRGGAAAVRLSRRRAVACQVQAHCIVLALMALEAAPKVLPDNLAVALHVHHAQCNEKHGRSDGAPPWTIEEDTSLLLRHF